MLTSHPGSGGCGCRYEDYSGTQRHVRAHLLKVMYSQPDLSLGVEHTAQVTPGHGKVGLGLDSLQIASL